MSQFHKTVLNIEGVLIQTGMMQLLLEVEVAVDFDPLYLETKLYESLACKRIFSTKVKEQFLTVDPQHFASFSTYLTREPIRTVT